MPSLSPQTAALIQYALIQVARNGTAKAIANEFPGKKLAGKTGTSDNFRDSWFIGLSANYLTTVWIGHDNNSTTGLSGSSGALQVWLKIMKVLRVKPLRSTLARGVVYEKVNLEQRSVVPKFCESDIVMPFAANSSPKTSSSCVKNLEGSERSQSTISRKIESRENKSIFIDWFKDLF